MIMVGNVRFYLRHGYDVVEQQQFAPTIRLAFMRKSRAPLTPRRGHCRR